MLSKCSHHTLIHGCTVHIFYYGVSSADPKLHYHFPVGELPSQTVYLSLNIFTSSTLLLVKAVVALSV